MNVWGSVGMGWSGVWVMGVWDVVVQVEVGSLVVQVVRGLGVVVKVVVVLGVVMVVVQVLVVVLLLQQRLRVPSRGLSCLRLVQAWPMTSMNASSNFPGSSPCMASSRHTDFYRKLTESS